MDVRHDGEDPSSSSERSIKERMIAAQRRLASALRWLKAAEYGGTPEASLTSAHAEIRAARADLAAACAAWLAREREHQETAPAPAPAPPSAVPAPSIVSAASPAAPPEDIPPRLHFVRWLVEHGRLTDWPDDRPKARTLREVA